jgi:hypothetical protein
VGAAGLALLGKAGGRAGAGVGGVTVDGRVEHSRDGLSSPFLIRPAQRKDRHGHHNNKKN